MTWLPKDCPLATATRSNPSAYQIPAASTSIFPPTPTNQFPHGGRGERSASPGPRRRVRLTTPTPFPLPSAHTTMCRNTLRPILCCTGALWSTGARGGGELTLLWHHHPFLAHPFPPPPPLPTLVYTHPPTLPHRSMNTVVCAGLGNGGWWFVGVAPGGLA